MKADYFALARRGRGYGILAVTLPRLDNGKIDHRNRTVQQWTGEIFNTQREAERVVETRNLSL